MARSAASNSTSKKKRKRVPPYTQMTLQYLREEERMLCAIAERYIRRGGDQEAWEGGAGGRPIFGFRQDLFNFIDIIAINEEVTIGVQTTSGGQRLDHYRKIMASVEARAWIMCPSRRIWLVTWTKKLVKRGGKVRRWVPRVTDITARDFGVLDAPF